MCDSDHLLAGNIQFLPNWVVEIQRNMLNFNTLAVEVVHLRQRLREGH